VYAARAIGQTVRAFRETFQIPGVGKDPAATQLNAMVQGEFQDGKPRRRELSAGGLKAEFEDPVTVGIGEIHDAFNRLVHKLESVYTYHHL
jgi:hypothetical protein